MNKDKNDGVSIEDNNRRRGDLEERGENRETLEKRRESKGE